MMNFITFQLKKRREDAANVTFALPSSGGKSKKTQQEKAKARKEKPKKEANKDYEDDNELPEVDQNTKQSLRQRKWKTKTKHIVAFEVQTFMFCFPNHYFQYKLCTFWHKCWSLINPIIDIFFLFCFLKNDACPSIQFLPTTYMCAMFPIYFLPLFLFWEWTKFDPLSIKGIYGTSFIHLSSQTF